jgi:hypothetical protein
MTDQRKAAAAGDHNTVTHAPADTPKPDVSPAAEHTAADKRVTLRCVQAYNVFQPSGDLPAVTSAGTSYTPEQADEVRTQARKNGVRVAVVDEEN